MIRPETDDLIKYLNELAQLDPVGLGKLVAAKVECNEDLAHHKSVQVSGDVGKAHVYHVGLLGILNGYAGVYESGLRAGWGPITAIVEDDGRNCVVTAD